MVDYLGKACVLLESAYPGVFAELKLPDRLRGSAPWNRAFPASEDAEGSEEA